MFSVSSQSGPDLGIVQDLFTLVPRLGVGILLLAILVGAGIVAGGRASDFTRRVGLSEAVLETPLGAPFQDERGVESMLQTLVKYLFYVLGVVVFLSLGGFGRLATYGDAVVRYFPSVIGGIVIVLAGFVIAGYVGRSIKTSSVVGGSDAAVVGAEATKGVIYLISITLGLDAFGYSTPILNTLAQAVAVGLGFGIAAAIGIGVGLGSQDYVAAHIEEWLNDESAE